MIGGGRARGVGNLKEGSAEIYSKTFKLSLNIMSKFKLGRLSHGGNLNHMTYASGSFTCNAMGSQIVMCES